MGSTITQSSLVVTVSEQIILGNQNTNIANQQTIDNINETATRIMTIPSASEVTIVAFSTAVAAGTFIRGDLRYLRIQNKDTVNYARIRVKKNGADTFDQRIDAGAFFIISNVKESVSATAASFSTFVDADSINMQADNAPIDIEYFVAST